MSILILTVVGAASVSAIVWLNRAARRQPELTAEEEYEARQY